MTDKPYASTAGLFDVVCHLLERDERDAVQGDLLESGESPWQSLLAVLGLVVRREAALWSSWRPWLAAFGLALPSSFLLMGFSISLSRTYLQLGDATFHRATLALFLCNVSLLLAWSWTIGFVVGSVSRRTVWVSAALSFAPCLFCLERFRVESLSRFCLLLFVPAALWGARRGLKMVRMKPGTAIALAMGVTALTAPMWSSSGAWIPDFALSWPAWYLAATARNAIRRSD